MPRLTLRQLFLLSTAAIALLVGVLLFVFLEGSRRSILETSQALRTAAARRVEEQVSASWGKRSKPSKRRAGDPERQRRRRRSAARRVGSLRRGHRQTAPRRGDAHPRHAARLRRAERFRRLNADGVTTGDPHACAVAFMSTIHSLALFELLTTSHERTPRKVNLRALMLVLWRGIEARPGGPSATHGSTKAAAGSSKANPRWRNLSSVGEAAVPIREIWRSLMSCAWRARS